MGKRKLRSRDELLDFQKPEWGTGEWQEEPDHVDFEHAGLPCILNRAPVSGAWCGYAAVPPGHKLHGVSYASCFHGCEKRPGDYISRKVVGKAKRRFNAMGGDKLKRELEMLLMMRKWYRSGLHRRVRSDHKRCAAAYELNHSPESVLRVHGGLTYSGKCQGAICHMPKPGQPDNVWWFGFDCSHAGDLAPRMVALTKSLNLKFKMPKPAEWAMRDWEKYRNMAYAKAETEHLAEQLAAFGR
jgi:hypothetical protein